jgi:adhesin transport system membrane fusion protein
MSVFERDSADKNNMLYMHDVDMAMHRRGHPWAFTLSLSILVFFLLFLLWSHFAMIDTVTRGSGQIIPAHGVQPIQSERGGTILEILVAENERVEKNQPLVNIANVREMSGLKELETRYVELSFALTRLFAEEQEQPLSYTDKEQREYPETAESQTRIFRTRLEQFESQSHMLLAQIEQRRREVAEARERKESYERTLLSLKQQEATYRPLIGRSVSELEALELKNRIITQEGELNSVAQTIARAESGVQASMERLKNLKAERQASIADEINKTRLEQSSVEQQIKAGGEQVTRFELRAPVRGTIKQISLKPGGVAKPAETILEILPTDGVLLVEAKFSPVDRGFLFVNQPAMVKVSAYEFSIYGGLEATVTKISQDTIDDKKGEPWYEVQLLTKRNSLLYRGEELGILPGMTVTVDVLTDKKTVLSHIFAPLRDAMQNAMTEH